MTLFTLLLVMLCERLFKWGQHWQLDHYLEMVFRRLTVFSLLRTLIMTVLSMMVACICILALKGWFFNVPLLFVLIALGLLCIGAGQVRLHYHTYLKAASQDDVHAKEAMVNELTLIHGIANECDEREYLTALQNALLWINYRFYLAPLFWFIVGGPIALVGYTFLRAFQTWFARFRTPEERLNAGIDRVLNMVDWVPVRLVGIVYALLGHGEKALPAWFTSLGDFHTPQYQVLATMAQYSLACEPHFDKVKTPKAAVSMAKRTSLVIVVIVALLTIYGALI